MTYTLPDTTGESQRSNGNLRARRVIVKLKKSKGESAKTETNAAFTVCCCSFSPLHKHEWYTVDHPPIVNCLKLNYDKFSWWKKCWHKGLFFGNDLSHEITSTDICLSFARYASPVSTLVVYKTGNWLELMSLLLVPTVSTLLLLEGI